MSESGICPMPNAAIGLHPFNSRYVSSHRCSSGSSAGRDSSVSIAAAVCFVGSVSCAFASACRYSILSFFPNFSSHSSAAFGSGDFFLLSALLSVSRGRNDPEVLTVLSLLRDPVAQFDSVRQ